MPRNNLKSNKSRKTFTPGSKKGPGLIYKKTIQDALIDGFNDPVAFCHDFLDIEPYPAQEEFLRKSKDTVESNFVAGNRVGKSWIAGVVLLWKAFYRHISPYLVPDKTSHHVSYKAVATSLTYDQAKLSWNYAHTFAQSKRFKPFVTDVVHSPFPTMKLSVRDERGEQVESEIWSRSLSKGGIHLLGHSISFGLTDECAYIAKYVQIEDEVLRMRLADQGGSLMRISTPNGRNFFYDLYASGLTGDPKYFSHRVTTLDNPYISKVYVEEMKRRMLAEYYQQNVLAEFVSLSDFFTFQTIQALYDGVEYLTKDKEPLDFPLAPERGAVYVMGIDLGAARDPSVVIIWRIDRQPVQTVYVGELRNTNWRASREFVANLYKTYEPITGSIDYTGVGAPIAQQLIEEDGLDRLVPFVFSNASKPEILVRLQDSVQRKKFNFPFVEQVKPLVNQMSFYRLDDKDIEQDYVISLALVNDAYERAIARNKIDTVEYEDLSVITLKRGGEELFGADTFGPGTVFDLDPSTGLFIPREEASYFDIF